MRRLFAALAGGAAIGAAGLSARYRRDMNTARARMAEVDRRVVRRLGGAVEFAEQGSGEPVPNAVPGAEFLSLGSGGHLMLGHAENVHDRLAEFFADHSTRSRWVTGIVSDRLSSSAR